MVFRVLPKLYANALGNAQHFVYMENQYFWTHAYYGVDLPFLGTDSPDMERNIAELAAALQRGATVALVLPDHPNVGRAFTDAGLTRLREEAPEAAAQGRIQAFCLAASAESMAQKTTGPSTCMRKSPSSTISGPRSAPPI